MKNNVLRPFSLRGKGLLLFVVLIYIIIYAPLMVMIVYSFNSPGPGVKLSGDYAHSYLRASEKWNGFSTIWYGRLFKNKHLLQALYVSLIVAGIAVPISIIIGTMTAVALFRFKFWGKEFFEQMLLTPLLLPEVVIGLSLLLFFVGVLNYRLGIGTIFVSHVAFTIPLVTLVVTARMRRLDPTLEEAAMTLGADEITTLRRVTLPLLMPGIYAAALLAFPWSFNDFIITYFVAGVGSTTLPIYIYSMLKVGVSSEVNAVGTLVIIVSLLLIVAASVIQTVRKR